METPHYSFYSVSGESKIRLSQALEQAEGRSLIDFESALSRENSAGILLFTEGAPAELEKLSKGEHLYVISLVADHSAGLEALNSGVSDYLIEKDLDQEEVLRKALTIAKRRLLEDRSSSKSRISIRDVSGAAFNEEIEKIADSIEGVLARHREKRDGTVENLYVSQGVRQLWGVSKEMAEKDPSAIWKRLEPEELEKLQKAFYRALESNEKLDHVYRINTPETGEKWLHVIALPSRLADGSVEWDSITSDITQLKMAEKSATEQSAFLNNIIKNIDGAVQRNRINPDGSEEVLFLSKGFTTISGIPLEEGMKDPELPWKQILEEDRVKLKTTLEKAVQSLSPWQETWRIIDSKGTLKWIRGSGIAVAQDDGSVILDAVLTDISELASAVEEVSSERRKFELAAKAARLGLWEFDIVNDDLKWDELMFSIFGLDPSDFTGSAEDWKRTLHPEDKDKAIEELERTIEMGMDFESQFRIIRPDNGDTRHIRATAKSVKDDEGKVIRMVGLNWDITYLVKIQEKLTETYKRYELASKATQDAVWDWDLKKDTIVWNDAFTRLFGHEVDYSGDPYKNWESYLHPEDREKVVEGLNAHIKSKGNQWEDRYRFRKKNGDYAYIFDRGFLVRDYNGKAMRMVGSMRDDTKITEFVKKLQSQNEKLRQIAWTQSHELRGPLSSILSLVQVARQDLNGELPTEDFLHRLENAADRLDRVVHRIVELSEQVDPGKEYSKELSQ